MLYSGFTYVLLQGSWGSGSTVIQPLQILYGHSSEVTSVAISVELDLAVSGSKVGAGGTCWKNLKSINELGTLATIVFCMHRMNDGKDLRLKTYNVSSLEDMNLVYSTSSVHSQNNLESRFELDCTKLPDNCSIFACVRSVFDLRLFCKFGPRNNERP